MSGELKSQRRILIVEDDADVRQGLTLRLRAAGYDIVQAADGASAMTQAASKRPDLILLDLGLPAGDGFTVLRRLRRMPTTAGTPVIVVSAWDPSAQRQRSLDEGAVAYLTKPPDNAVLLATIAEHMPEAVSPAAMTRARVLLIEDDADIRLAIQVRLEANGLDTSFAADATTALTQAMKFKPDVILLDLGLPGGDGLKLLERFRAHAQLGAVPVIVLSARDAAIHRPKSLASGATDYIQKPADPAALIAAIRRALPAGPA